MKTLAQCSPRQLTFIKIPREFGGSTLAGKRKEARPISTKKAMHLILKSENAKGIFAFINHLRALELAIAKVSARFQVKLYKLSVNNDHIHLIPKFKSRALYRAWIKTLTAEIVRIISRRTKRKLKDFFTQRPYTKIVNWGRHLGTAVDYVVLNQMEYFGLRPAKKSSRRKNIAPRNAQAMISHQNSFT